MPLAYIDVDANVYDVIISVLTVKNFKNVNCQRVDMESLPPLSPSIPSHHGSFEMSYIIQ